MKLDDLFDLDALEKAIADGNVRVQTHPDDERLRIYNYTEQAQWTRTWDEVTTQCRGLIVRGDEVIARPWPKFFNYGEHPEGSLDLHAPVQVTDKLDGSLGILYDAPDGPAIATRGSFTSQQAIHATAIYRERYASQWSPPDQYTFLFEIVYPDNRIVVDYGATDDLFLLGAVHTASGKTIGPVSWPGSSTVVFGYSSLADALSAPTRRNAEGLVVRYDNGLMVKLKQEDYVALHRIVTGLNERVVWEHIRDTGGADGLLASLPEEFQPWVRDVEARLLKEAGEIAAGAALAFRQITTQLPTGWTRKEFAQEAVKSDYRPWLFMLLDGKEPWPSVWATVKPSGAVKLVNWTEDVA